MELGPGDGANFALYPTTVTEVIAEDESVDAVLASLVLCTVPDQAAALAEARRGFVVERCDRFPFSPSPIIPRIPHVLGVARRP